MNQPNRHPYAPLRIPEFRFFLAGRFIFIMGLRMTGTVLGWWVYQLTNSPFTLGLVGLAEVIPALTLALYAGHYIDQHEKRKVLLNCVLLYIVCIGLFVWLSHPSIEQNLSPHLLSIIILSIIAGTGAIRSFSGPTFSSLIAQIVPKDILPAAASISSATWLIASITGHATAGFLIAWIGTHHTFWVILSCVVLGFLLLYQLKHKPVLIKQVPRNTRHSVQEGLQYVFKTKELLGAMSLDLFAVLFGGAVAMVPVFAKDILFIGPIGFGWLNAATDIGSILTVTYLTIRPLRHQQGRKLFFAVAGYGACIVIFAFSQVFWLSFLALLISGVMDGVSVIVRSTILQLKTPDHLRGRVMSVSSMFINSSNELGQFESGLAAKLMGVVPSVIFGGCMTILVVVTTWFKAPSLRKMEY
ncbi:MAG TPA: MFS transporter [Ferruginibacter sp.]|nr:MFS transporter [Ferruginibacter sp.]